MTEQIHPIREAIPSESPVRLGEKVTLWGLTLEAVNVLKSGERLRWKVVGPPNIIALLEEAGKDLLVSMIPKPERPEGMIGSLLWNLNLPTKHNHLKTRIEGALREIMSGHI